MTGLQLVPGMRERRPSPMRRVRGWEKESSKGRKVVLYRVLEADGKHRWYADLIVDGGGGAVIRRYGTAKHLALLRARRWARAQKADLIVSKW